MDKYKYNKVKNIVKDWPECIFYYLEYDKLTFGLNYSPEYFVLDFNKNVETKYFIFRSFGILYRYKTTGIEYIGIVKNVRDVVKYIGV